MLSDPRNGRDTSRVPPLTANSRDAGRAVSPFTDMAFSERFAKNKAPLVVATFNCDGLSDHKLHYILWYMQTFKINILCLQDTRLDRGRGLYIAKIVKNTLGPGTVTITVPASPPTLQKGVGKYSDLASRRFNSPHYL